MDDTGYHPSLTVNSCKCKLMENVNTKRIKMKKFAPLSEKGIGHYLIPLVLVVLIAVGGVYAMVSSKASPSSSNVFKPRLYIVAKPDASKAGFNLEELRERRPTSPGSGKNTISIKVFDGRDPYHAHGRASGVKIKLSTVDVDRDGKRNKKYGCGNNGSNKYRDRTAITNSVGVATFEDCTDGLYLAKLSGKRGLKITGYPDYEDETVQLPSSFADPGGSTAEKVKIWIRITTHK